MLPASSDLNEIILAMWSGSSLVSFFVHIDGFLHIAVISKCHNYAVLITLPARRGKIHHTCKILHNLFLPQAISHHSDETQSIFPGTFLSGTTVFCCAKVRPKGTAKVIVLKTNACVALLQFLTTFIFLLGWIWSIMWGASFITIFRE